jgi:hypothetical protein
MTLKAIIIAVAVIMAAGALVLFLKSRTVKPQPVQVHQIPEIVRQLRSKGQNASWVVFLFAKPGTTSDDDVVNLQFSVEDGHAGLDWVLLAPRNIKDRGAIEAFAAQRGFRMQEKQSNGVQYLRVEGKGTDSLGVAIAAEFYGLAETDTMDMISDKVDLQL